MLRRRDLERLEAMLDAAIDGTFRESDYDETVLSRIEAKWKHFLGSSIVSKEDLAREKDKLKGLISDIAHQTKTPMANIHLYTELLEEKMEGGEENTRLLTELKAQTEKLEFLIQALTKLSRLESNIVVVKPRVQKVADLLADVLEDIRYKAEQNKIEICCTYEGDATACYDRKWTKEALGNVLDNAVKYSSPGSEVLVSVQDYEMYEAVSVKDHGIGIREEDTAKIFGRFYRAQDVQQEEGVGIGLYLAREVLKRENGYIRVRSMPGQGSEFALFLPKGGSW